jgi:hypothetical protein
MNKPSGHASFLAAADAVIGYREIHRHKIADIMALVALK